MRRKKLVGDAAGTVAQTNVWVGRVGIESDSVFLGIGAATDVKCLGVSTSVHQARRYLGQSPGRNASSYLFLLPSNRPCLVLRDKAEPDEGSAGGILLSGTFAGAFATRELGAIPDDFEYPDRLVVWTLCCDLAVLGQR